MIYLRWVLTCIHIFVSRMQVYKKNDTAWEEILQMPLKIKNHFCVGLEDRNMNLKNQ